MRWRLDIIGKFYPPSQKTTGMPVDECDSGEILASAGCPASSRFRRDPCEAFAKEDSPSLERRIIPAKLLNKNWGAKQNH